MFDSINSPLDLLGSVAAQHHHDSNNNNNYPILLDEYPFSQLSADSHSLLVYDHQLSNDGSNKLAYRTYSMDRSQHSNHSHYSTQNRTNHETFDDNHNSNNLQNTSDVKVEGSSPIVKEEANVKPTPTSSVNAADIVNSIKSSSVKNLTLSDVKNRSEQHLLYLSPEVCKNSLLLNFPSVFLLFLSSN